MANGLLNPQMQQMMGLLGPQRQGGMNPFAAALQGQAAGMMAPQMGGPAQMPQPAPMTPPQPAPQQPPMQPQASPQPSPQAASQSMPSQLPQTSPFAREAFSMGVPPGNPFGNLGYLSVEGGGVPWANPEQWRAGGGQAALDRIEQLGVQLPVEARIRGAFPHWTPDEVQQAITGEAPGGSSGSGAGGGPGNGGGGSLEEQFPHSAGKFPLDPFSPIPAGLQYQQARDIISTGGTEQGTPGSAPSQAVQSLEFIRSLVSKAKR